MKDTPIAFVASVTLKVFKMAASKVPFECLVENNNENYNLMK